jgi:alanine racemase
MQAEILIDVAALRANARALRDLAAPSQFIAVVKANAYGHGLSIVAPAIADIADAFGVYEVSEAVALRDLGIRHPIHVLGAIPPGEFGAALDADVIFACWDDGAWLHELVDAAAAKNTRARIQVKVDSGLSRLGARPFETLRIIESLRAESRVELTGAYSHLASAEELDSRYTMDQLVTFENAVPPGSVPQRHIAASAAAMLWPQTRLDAIRVGIALYGLWPSKECRSSLGERLQLQPALQWHSHLVSVHEIPAHTPVGYGCTYRSPVHTRIGIIPIGYAEGLPRLLSNTGKVLIDGVACPIVGRICMNMTFVDLAAVPEADIHSDVRLIGSYGNASVSADDMAFASQTISYEIVARLPTNIIRTRIDIGRTDLR